MNDHKATLPLSEQTLPVPCECCGEQVATVIVFGWLFLCKECAGLVEKYRIGKREVM